MNSNVARHFKVTFHRRPYFYFNSLVFYQFLTLVLACTLQFTDSDTSTEQGAFGGVSMAAAVIAFVFATLYPLFHLFWMRHKREDLIPRPISYSNRYH